MSRYESEVKLIIVVIQIFAVLRFKTQKQKFGENKHCNWPEEITPGSKCTEEQMKRQCIVALQKFLFNR